MSLADIGVSRYNDEVPSLEAHIIINLRVTKFRGFGYLTLTGFLEIVEDISILYEGGVCHKSKEKKKTPREEGLDLEG